MTRYKFFFSNGSYSVYDATDYARYVARYGEPKLPYRFEPIMENEQEITVRNKGE